MTTPRPTRKLLSPPNSVLNLQCPTPLFTPNMFNTSPSSLLTSSQPAEKDNGQSWLNRGNQHSVHRSCQSGQSYSIARDPIKSKEYIILTPPKPLTNLKASNGINHPQTECSLTKPFAICIPKIMRRGKAKKKDGDISLEDMRTTKRKRKHPQSPIILACHVCGDNAGKHSYYGGQACISCRAFFRRAVQTKYNLAYFCAKKMQCNIYLKARKACQYCRYQACLAAEMKPNWVLNEEEKRIFLEGRGKNKEEKKKEPDNEVFKTPLPPPKTVHPIAYISDEEMVEIQKYVKTSGYFDISKVYDLGAGLVRELIRLIAFQQPLSNDGQTQLQRTLARRSRRFARKLGDFQKLRKHDQEKLLAQNIPLMMEMQICTFFTPSLAWDEQLTPLMGEEEVETLKVKLIMDMNLEHLDTMKVFFVSMFPSPPPHSEDQFADLMIDIGSWPMDATEYVLLSLAILFCPDMLDLMDRSTVGNIQHKFVVLLQKYLNNKHQDSPSIATTRFGQGINCIAKCKDMHAIFIK